jgi:hypothetical protein
MGRGWYKGTMTLNKTKQRSVLFGYFLRESRVRAVYFFKMKALVDLVRATMGDQRRHDLVRGTPSEHGANPVARRLLVVRRRARKGVGLRCFGAAGLRDVPISHEKKTNVLVCISHKQTKKKSVIVATSAHRAKCDGKHNDEPNAAATSVKRRQLVFGRNNCLR